MIYGSVAIPMKLFGRLGMTLEDVQTGVTADGRAGYFDTVELTILWHDKPLLVQAQVLDEALIGTRLLRGNRLEADWVRDGEAYVRKLI